MANASQDTLTALAELAADWSKQAKDLETRHMQPDCTFNDMGAAATYNDLHRQLNELQIIVCRNYDDAKFFMTVYYNRIKGL